MFLPHPRVKVSIVGSLLDREVAWSASDRQGSNFESCVWRTVSSQSSHHTQEVLLAQFSLYVHKGGLKPDSFHFIYSIVVHARGALLSLSIANVFNNFLYFSVRYAIVDSDRQGVIGLYFLISNGVNACVAHVKRCKLIGNAGDGWTLVYLYSGPILQTFVHT